MAFRTITVFSSLVFREFLIWTTILNCLPVGLGHQETVNSRMHNFMGPTSNTVDTDSNPQIKLLETQQESWKPNIGNLFQNQASPTESGKQSFKTWTSSGTSKGENVGSSLSRDEFLQSKLNKNGLMGFHSWSSKPTFINNEKLILKDNHVKNLQNGTLNALMSEFFPQSLTINNMSKDGTVEFRSWPSENSPLLRSSGSISAPVFYKLDETGNGPINNQQAYQILQPENNASNKGKTNLPYQKHQNKKNIRVETLQPFPNVGHTTDPKSFTRPSDTFQTMFEKLMLPSAVPFSSEHFINMPDSIKKRIEARRALQARNADKAEREKGNEIDRLFKRLPLADFNREHLKVSSHEIQNKLKQMVTDWLKNQTTSPKQKENNGKQSVHKKQNMDKLTKHVSNETYSQEITHTPVKEPQSTEEKRIAQQHFTRQILSVVTSTTPSTHSSTTGKEKQNNFTTGKEILHSTVRHGKIADIINFQNTRTRNIYETTTQSYKITNKREIVSKTAIGKTTITDNRISLPERMRKMPKTKYEEMSAIQRQFKSSSDLPLSFGTTVKMQQKVQFSSLPVDKVVAESNILITSSPIVGKGITSKHEPLRTLKNEAVMNKYDISVPTTTAEIKSTNPGITTKRGKIQQVSEGRIEYPFTGSKVTKVKNESNYTSKHLEKQTKMHYTTVSNRGSQTKQKARVSSKFKKVKATENRTTLSPSDKTGKTVRVTQPHKLLTVAQNQTKRSIKQRKDKSIDNLPQEKKITFEPMIHTYKTTPSMRHLSNDTISKKAAKMNVKSNIITNDKITDEIKLTKVDTKDKPNLKNINTNNKIKVKENKTNDQKIIKKVKRNDKGNLNKVKSSNNLESKKVKTSYKSKVKIVKASIKTKPKKVKTSNKTRIKEAKKIDKTKLKRVKTNNILNAPKNKTHVNQELANERINTELNITKETAKIQTTDQQVKTTKRLLVQKHPTSVKPVIKQFKILTIPEKKESKTATKLNSGFAFSSPKPLNVIQAKRNEGNKNSLSQKENLLAKTVMAMPNVSAETVAKVNTNQLQNNMQSENKRFNIENESPVEMTAFPSPVQKPFDVNRRKIKVKTGKPKVTPDIPPQLKASDNLETIKKETNERIRGISKLEKTTGSRYLNPRRNKFQKLLLELMRNQNAHVTLKPKLKETTGANSVDNLEERRKPKLNPRRPQYSSNMSNDSLYYDEIPARTNKPRKKINEIPTKSKPNVNKSNLVKPTLSGKADISSPTKSVKVKKYVGSKIGIKSTMSSTEQLEKLLAENRGNSIQFFNLPKISRNQISKPANKINPQHRSKSFPLSILNMLHGDIPKSKRKKNLDPVLPKVARRFLKNNISNASPEKISEKSSNPFSKISFQTIQSIEQRQNLIQNNLHPSRVKQNRIGIKRKQKELGYNVKQITGVTASQKVKDETKNPANENDNIKSETRSGIDILNRLLSGPLKRDGQSQVFRMSPFSSNTEVSKLLFNPNNIEKQKSSGSLNPLKVNRMSQVKTYFDAPKSIDYHQGNTSDQQQTSYINKDGIIRPISKLKPNKGRKKKTLTKSQNIDVSRNMVIQRWLNKLKSESNQKMIPYNHVRKQHFKSRTPKRTQDIRNRGIKPKRINLFKSFERPSVLTSRQHDSRQVYRDVPKENSLERERSAFKVRKNEHYISENRPNDFIPKKSVYQNNMGVVSEPKVITLWDIKSPINGNTLLEQLSSAENRDSNSIPIVNHKMADNMENSKVTDQTKGNHAKIAPYNGSIKILLFPEQFMF